MAPAIPAPGPYEIYGLTLRANRPLPYLAPAPGPLNEVDVLLELGTGDSPLPTVPTGHHVAEYSGPDGFVRFVVDPEGARIRADWRRDSAVKLPRDITALLGGPILGTVLRMRSAVSLHACVLDVASRAVVVAGPAGAGKSTLAAAMARAGHPVLSDDVGALVRDAEGRWIAHAGYPGLRLEPEELRRLGVDADGDRVQTRQTKRYLELAEGSGEAPWRFQAEPLEVAGVYVLERHNVAALSVERLGVSARVEGLIQQIRPSAFPLAPDTRAAELKRLARLAEDVEVCRLHCPDGLDSLGATCEAVVREVAQPDG
jgi:hypothetical protein